MYFCTVDQKYLNSTKDLVFASTYDILITNGLALFKNIPQFVGFLFVFTVRSILKFFVFGTKSSINQNFQGEVALFSSVNKLEYVKLKQSASLKSRSPLALIRVLLKHYVSLLFKC